MYAYMHTCMCEYMYIYMCIGKNALYVFVYVGLVKMLDDKVERVEVEVECQCKGPSFRHQERQKG